MKSLEKLDPLFKSTINGKQIAQDLIYKLSSELALKNIYLKSVYLFGSACEDRMTVHSDLDLLITLESKKSRWCFFYCFSLWPEIKSSIMTPPKMILFKKEYSLDLFNIALGDLETAKALLDSEKPGRYENILYMIQQAIEKSIKCILIHKQIALPMIHDLIALNPYASIRRYELGPIPLEFAEVEGAYRTGTEVIQWAKSYLNKID